jgi:ABC-type lipoprotein release transport system permease subunit
MPEQPPASASARPQRLPALGYNTVHIALRYLLKKKLAYLAVVGIALSVGTFIVVMSVFTGFHDQLTGIIRGYLSDLIVQPRTGGLHTHGLRDWQLFRRLALEQPHVEGAAPFVQSVALVRLARTDYMSYVFVRGVEPELEPTVSDLRDYVVVGRPSDLARTYANPEGGRLAACFVGREFPAFSEASLRRGPGQLILVTATRDLDRRLRKYAVNGMFATGNYEYDSQMVLLGLKTATDLVGSDGGVTGLSVKLDRYDHAPAVRGELADRLARGALLRSFAAGAGKLTSVALSGNGSRAAALTQAGEVLLWDAVVEEPLLRLPPTTSPGTAATALAPDYAGARLLVGRQDGTAAVLPVADDAAPVTVRGGDGAVTALAFSPDGLAAAIGYAGGAVRLADPDDGEEIALLEDHADAVVGIAFDAHGDRLVTACADGSARVRDAFDGELVARLEARSGETAPPLRAAAFAAGRDVVATGDAEGRVTLWEAASGRSLMRWRAHAGPVLALGPGERGGQLVTAGRDGFAVWLVSGAGGMGVHERYAAVPAEAPLEAAAMAADGTRLVGVDSSGRARLHSGGSGFRIETWEEQRRSFVEAVAMERFLMALILSLILVVAEFFIFAIVTTIVNERRRDIGILKAVGFTRGQICTVFLLVGLAIGVAGAALGVGAGLLFADNINPVREFIKVTVGFDPFPPDIYYFKDIPAVVTPFSVLLTAGGAVVCSLVFSIIPALRAARLDPVRTLHYE